MTVSNILLICLPAVLIICITLMCIYLKKSLKETLYTYKNILLLGGILFFSVLATVLIKCLITAVFSGGVTNVFLFREIIKFPKRFSFYAVFFMIAVSVLLGVSNIALIRHEGMRLHNALSIVFALFYIGGTVIIYIISNLLTKKVFIPRGIYTDSLFLVLNTVIPLFLVLMLCYFECILAGTAVMGYKASREVPTYDRDYIIILGCSIDKRGGLLPLLKGRVNRAIRFAWEQEIATGRPMKYVPSGGQGANEVMSEGSAMELYLLTRGAESYEVLPEKKSANTWENLCFSKKIIDEINPNAKVVFATTNYHMLRSGILARKAGLDAQGVAGDTKWYFWPNGFIREFFGILTMNIKSHIFISAVLAVICAVIGVIGYFGNFI